MRYPTQAARRARKNAPGKLRAGNAGEGAVAGRAERPGRMVMGVGGYKAYVPEPLPPAIIWTPTLVCALSDADRRIGQLAGEGGRLPKPHLLIRPFIAREAVFSSQIEGTQATLGELLAAEAGARVMRSPDDLREVANYVVALEYGVARLRDLPLSLRLIRECHLKLMTGVRGSHATPGEFRRSQNWIGPPGSTPNTATYVPPPPAEMRDCLYGWEKFLHETTLPPLVQAALLHYQFEAIHPFLDGNGRIGRLLLSLFLVQRGILPKPVLYLSAFFAATRPDYYAYLRGVTERGEWNYWLEYVLNGIARQAEDASSRAERINALLARWQLAAARCSTRVPEMLLAQLAQNPFLTVKRVAQRLQLAFTTIQRGVRWLEEQKIVTEISHGRRDRVYCAKAVLAILEEPANLTPMEQ